jgi:hypothetical protein
VTSDYLSKNKQSFVTTMDYSDNPFYFERVQIINRSYKTIFGELSFIPKILRTAKQTQLLLLDSSSGRVYPDLLASILIGFWSKSHRPKIVFMGAMWQKDPGFLGLIEKILIRLANRAIYRFAVQSTDEFPLFSEAWGITESKLRFVPFFHTFTTTDLLVPAPPLQNFIFSGGNSHRDYQPYLDAISYLPNTNLSPPFIC